MKGFGALWSESWREYKSNFRVLFKIFFWFVLLPLIVFLLYDLIFLNSELLISSVTDSDLDFAIFSASELGIFISITILSVILGFIAYLSYLSTALFKEKRTGANIKKGLKILFPLIGFWIVAGIFLIGLLILLIIPGIIFAIYWIFAVYIYFMENKGILASLKESRRLVRGKWWRTLGFLILIGIIFWLINFVFSIPINISGFLAVISQGIPVKILAAIGNILASFGKLVTIPLGFFFFKNFYLDMKKSSGKSQI